MGAYRDKRSGRWRYRKWIDLPDGRRERITGTPAIDTKKAALHAEELHVRRVLSPVAVPMIQEPPEADKNKEVPTLKEYAAIFLSHYLPNQKPSERASKESILNGQLIPYFGPKRLDEIRQTDVDAFATEQLRRVEPKTVNNRLGVLSTLLRYAVANDVIDGRKLKCHVGGVSAEVVAVPAADVAKLLAVTKDDRYRVAILLASEGGLRIGEIRGLQWGDVDGDAGQLTVRRAIDVRGNVTSPKHDKRRTVPLSELLAGALTGLRRRGLWIVSRLDGQMLTYWAARDALVELYARAKVPLAPMPWHSLRHSFGTALAARNVPLPVIKELMGHSSITTTLRYVTVADDQKRDAIARAFGQQVGNSVGKRSEVARK